MTAVLADLGGTHLRLARIDGEGHGRFGPSEITKLRLSDHASFEDALRAFAPDASSLYLATAVMPRGGVIEDARFGDARWRIDLAALARDCGLGAIHLYNDLEAAAHALPGLSASELDTIAPATGPSHGFDDPPRLLVSVGTGIGHAFLFERKGADPFVQRTHGGHFPALAATAEQKSILAAFDAAKPPGRDLIAEDLVSGNAYARLSDRAGPAAPRLLCEFLGLYCNMLVSAVGAYGGVYLSGGLTDEFHRAGLLDPAAFVSGFRRPMVPVVEDALAATPVYYARERNLPLRGLAALHERLRP